MSRNTAHAPGYFHRLPVLFCAIPTGGGRGRWRSGCEYAGSLTKKTTSTTKRSRCWVRRKKMLRFAAQETHEYARVSCGDDIIQRMPRKERFFFFHLEPVPHTTSTSWRTWNYIRVSTKSLIVSPAPPPALHTRQAASAAKPTPSSHLTLSATCSALYLSPPPVPRCERHLRRSLRSRPSRFPISLFFFFTLISLCFLCS